MGIGHPSEPQFPCPPSRCRHADLQPRKPVVRRQEYFQVGHHASAAEGELRDTFRGGVSVLKEIQHVLSMRLYDFFVNNYIKFRPKGHFLG